jgi:hypothetical protein
METLQDRRWVLLEEGYPIACDLTELEADEMLERYKSKFTDLEYCLFWDEYYEFTEMVTQN